MRWIRKVGLGLAVLTMTLSILAVRPAPAAADPCDPPNVCFPGCPLICIPVFSACHVIEAIPIAGPLLCGGGSLP